MIIRKEYYYSFTIYKKLKQEIIIIFYVSIKLLMHLRSEERRVGKEC